MTASQRVVLVTGASRGIGRAIALAFAGQGWHVVASYRREQQEAERTAALAASFGGSMEWRRADIAEPAQVAALFAGLQRLDALVNNAGVTRDGMFPTMPAADWNGVIATNLGGLFHCTQAALRLMLPQRRGAVINIGSSAAASARVGQANYAAAKSGLLGFTRSLARAVAGSGVRVIGAAPGFTVTDMARAVPEAAARETLPRIPLARWGEAAEVAALVIFLASEAASGFAGQTLLVDGGRTAFEAEFGL